jgi:hypothetical protein
MQAKDFSILRRAEMQMKKDVAQDFQGIVNSTMATPEASQRNRWCTNGRAFNRCRAFFFCVAVLLFVARANSQTAGAGSIQGTVTDPSGAVIPNASVSLTEASTHVTLTTKSTSTGTYVFPNIKVGTYSVNVVAPGFETYTSTGNVLEIGSSIAIDAKLTVGSADAKIVVRSEGLALQTEDASFKQTIDNTELTQMPLNGRHMTDLVVIAGGSNAAGV